MAKPDPYADIDFEEITDATGLAIDEIKCLKVGGLHYCCGDLDCNKLGMQQRTFCCFAP